MRLDIATVGGATTLIKLNPTVDTAAYAANDCIGGKLTLANAVRAQYGTAVLESLNIIDVANQKAALEIFIFDSNPSVATLTDQLALVLGADVAKVIAHITVAATDYTTVTAASIAMVTFKGLGIVLASNEATTSLYAAICAVGTPDFVAATDLSLHFGILQD